MNSFPVITSTLSPTNLATFLDTKYETGGDATCRLLKAGINHTYYVEGSNGKFIFRVYSCNWRTELEILEEIRLLDILNKNQIPVSFALADQTGKYIQTFHAPEGDRFGVMFSYAAGEKILNYSPELHEHVGSVMAQMHRITQSVKLERVNYTPEVLLIHSLNHLQRFLGEGSDETAWMLATQKYLRGEFEKIKTDQIRHGAVHLDLWFDNINFNDKGEVTIFDFDFCGNGFLCLDIAFYILQIHSTEKEEAERNAKMEAFLKGYESIVPITDEEKRIIPMLGVSLYFFYLGVQSQRYDNWSNVFLNEVYLKRYIVMLVKKYYDSNGLG